MSGFSHWRHGRLPYVTSAGYAKGRLGASICFPVRRGGLSDKKEDELFVVVAVAASLLEAYGNVSVEMGPAGLVDHHSEWDDAWTGTLDFCRFKVEGFSLSDEESLSLRKEFSERVSAFLTEALCEIPVRSKPPDLIRSR